MSGGTPGESQGAPCGKAVQAGTPACGGGTGWGGVGDRDQRLLWQLSFSGQPVTIGY